MTESAIPETNLLGSYLRDRRAKLDPATLGIAATRRRTPGLRREEVAQRANVSATWYTWLEQGRGGAPSADVLDRIAVALNLTVAEREHLFLLAQHRLPEARFESFQPVSAQLQRVLDSLEFSPAIVKTAMWDIVAWNHAASVMFTNYASLSIKERNSIRILFCNADVRRALVNWDKDVRSAVASFRLDVTRVADAERVKNFIDEMSEISPQFREIWSDYAVRNHGEGVKLMRHPEAGIITFEYSTFTVDERPDLDMVLYTPASPADRKLIQTIIETRSNAAQSSADA